MEHLYLILGGILILFLVWKFFKSILKIALVLVLGYLLYHFFIR